MKGKFRYFFATEGTPRLYYRKSGGQVVSDGDRVPLQSDPIDWAETEILYARGDMFSGIFRTLSLSVAFVKDGREILHHIATSQRGYESRCLMIIEKLDSTTQLYLPYFEGAVNFSRAELTELQYNVEMQDAGLAALLIAKEDTVFELPINPGGGIRTLMDGVFLRTTYNYVPLGITWDNGNDPAVAQGYWTVPIGFVGREGDYEVALSPSQQLNKNIPTVVGATFSDLEYANYAFAANQQMDVVIEGRLQVTFTVRGGGSSTFTMLMIVAGSDRKVKSITTVSPAQPATPNGASSVIEFAINQSLSLDTGDRIMFVFPSQAARQVTFRITANPTTEQIYTLAIRSTFRLPRTDAQGDRYHDFCAKLFGKMSDGKYGFRSDYLSNRALVAVDNKPWNTIVTSGDALRRIGNIDKPAKLKSSPGDAVKHALDMWQVGLGIERDAAGNEIIRMEHESHFYRNNEVMCDLGIVPFPAVTYMQDKLYGGLQVGVEKQDYDGLNGKDEPNMIQQWDFPTLTQPGKRWDMVSPFRWDMYGIEFTRSKYIEKKTTDDSSDDSVFLFEVNDNPSQLTYRGVTLASFYTLARRQNDPGNNLTGMLFPASAYNAAMSPKRNLLRNGSIIRASLYQQEGQKITFQTNNKNADVASNLGSGLIVERQDIPVESLPAPLYLPILFTFTAPAPRNFPDLINAVPYGRVNFSVMVRGIAVQFGGFIDQVRLKPGNNEAAEWSLIACPDVDLSQLK